MMTEIQQKNGVVLACFYIGFMFSLQFIPNSAASQECRDPEQVDQIDRWNTHARQSSGQLFHKDSTKSIGTGFFINESNYLITAAHVLRNISLDGLFFKNYSGHRYAIRAIDISHDTDIAVMKVIGDNITPNPSWISFRSTLGFSRPEISRDAKYAWYSPEADKLLPRTFAGNDETRLFVDTNYAPGNSGSPIFDPCDGKVSGILLQAYPGAQVSAVLRSEIIVSHLNNLGNIKYYPEKFLSKHSLLIQVLRALHKTEVQRNQLFQSIDRIRVDHKWRAETSSCSQMSKNLSTKSSQNISPEIRIKYEKKLEFQHDVNKFKVKICFGFDSDEKFECAMDLPESEFIMREVWLEMTPSWSSQIDQSIGMISLTLNDLSTRIQDHFLKNDVSRFWSKSEIIKNLRWFTIIGRPEIFGTKDLSATEFLGRHDIVVPRVWKFRIISDGCDGAATQIVMDGVSRAVSQNETE